VIAAEWADLFVGTGVKATYSTPLGSAARTVTAKQV